MPIVQSSYRPPAYLFNSHLQTLAPVFSIKPNNNLYQTEKFELPDGDFLELDWIKRGHHKLMILCHGLEGNSRSHYVQQMALHFSKTGWDILALNLRGCGKEINRLPILYHGGSTKDVATIVEKYAHYYNSLVLVGFSLGANILLNFIARHATPPNLLAAAAFSVPCDLYQSEQLIDKFFNRLYAQKFVTKLKNKVRKLEIQHPGIADINSLINVKSIQKFTAEFASPLCNFGTVEDYYSTGNCLNSLKDTNIPTLVVNAQNDMFLSKSSYPVSIAEKSNYVYLDMPKHGGHAAFPISFRESWMSIRLERFLNGIIGN